MAKRKGALQTVIVKKTLAPTRSRARQEARKHADRIYTSRETGTSFRFRQRPPKCFQKSSYRTECIRRGSVCLVYGQLKAKMRDRKECRRS